MNACCSGCGRSGVPSPFERHDFLADDRGQGSHTRPSRRAIDVNSASAALAEPTAELGSVERELVAEHVEERRVRF
jgi:hypothetical protein